MPEKSTGNSKKYNVSIQSTNGTIISSVGDNANIEITQHTLIGGVEHYFCGYCATFVPISQYLVHQSAH
jgi:hypothetical protein